MRESHKLKVLNFFLLKINKIIESIGKPHKPHHLFLMSCGMNLMLFTCFIWKILHIYIFWYTGSVCLFWIWHCSWWLLINRYSLVIKASIHHTAHNLRALTARSSNPVYICNNLVMIAIKTSLIFVDVKVPKIKMN